MTNGLRTLAAELVIKQWAVGDHSTANLGQAQLLEYSHRYYIRLVYISFNRHEPDSLKNKIQNSLCCFSREPVSAEVRVHTVHEVWNLILRRDALHKNS